MSGQTREAQSSRIGAEEETEGWETCFSTLCGKTTVCMKREGDEEWGAL